MDLTGCGTYKHPDRAVVIFRGKGQKKDFFRGTAPYSKE